MMKKNFMFATMSAIALAGTMGLTACSSSEEEAVTEEINPTYNTITNEVTTQFVLNVASAEGATRSSSTTVQRNHNFRGMQETHLIALSTGNGSWLAPYDGGTTASYAVKKVYELGTLYGPTAVDNTGTNNQDNSSRRVLELAMPLTTDAMLVYAHAIQTADNDENGKMTATFADDVKDITFNLTSRVGTRKAEYIQTRELACKILNRIVASQVAAVTGANTWSRNGYSNKADMPATSWAALGAAVDGGALSPLEEILGKAYNTLTTINAGEFRAGSSSAISSIAFYIYNTSKSVYDATATDDKELNGQRLAQEIMRRIHNYFEGYDSENSTEFLNLTDIKKNMCEATGMTESAFDSNYNLVQHGDLKEFPTSFGLPLGVSLLQFDGTEFSHVSPPNSLLKDGTLAVENYMYPAELIYFNNSGLRVNTTSLKAENYPNGYGTWSNDASWTADGWTNGSVSSTTRSVAVKNNINYGVAMLETKVGLDGSLFNDNRAAITGEADQSLSANEVKNFQLVGVLVGGQNKQVGWNLIAKNALPATDWEYVIYDNKVEYGSIPTAEGEANYTLVFDNYMPDAAQTDEIYVALEFKNNGKDFYGKGNMIRTGGTFYLVGKLKLSEATNTITWPTDYAIPPYTAGVSTKTPRVFIQDHMTTATFKIGANSLKSAFVTVPDLRSSQTSLGLSVDLKWQTGLNFNAVLGQ